MEVCAEIKVILSSLTLCILGNFMLFCRLLFFFKFNFSKSSLQNTIRVSNTLDPVQARQNVGPELDPNCLQRLSADETK